MQFADFKAAYRCAVKGHNHDCAPVLHHKNVAGDLAVTYECPTGNYRWLIVNPNIKELTDSLCRQNKPRFGWRNHDPRFAVLAK